MTKTDSSNRITIAGATRIYTITVTNSGPGTSTNVVLTDTLPGGVTFVSATPGQGSCSGTSTLTCNLGTLTNGTNTTVTTVITLNPVFNGITTNAASVTTTESDPNSGNNSVTATTTVSAPAVARSLSKWGLLALAVLQTGAFVWSVSRRKGRRRA